MEERFFKHFPDQNVDNRKHSRLECSFHASARYDRSVDFSEMSHLDQELVGQFNTHPVSIWKTDLMASQSVSFAAHHLWCDFWLRSLCTVLVPICGPVDSTCIYSFIHSFIWSFNSLSSIKPVLRQVQGHVPGTYLPFLDEAARAAVFLQEMT